MAERRVEVRPFGVRYMCDTCKQGEMIALTGTQAFVQEQGQIYVRHVCNVCRNMAAYTEKYPTVRYEDVPAQGYATSNQMYQQPVPQGNQQPQQQLSAPVQPVQQQQPIQQPLQPQQNQPLQLMPNNDMIPKS